MSAILHDWATLRNSEDTLGQKQKGIQRVFFLSESHTTFIEDIDSKNTSCITQFAKNTGTDSTGFMGEVARAQGPHERGALHSFQEGLCTVFKRGSAQCSACHLVIFN